MKPAPQYNGWSSCPVPGAQPNYHGGWNVEICPPKRGVWGGIIYDTPPVSKSSEQAPPAAPVQVYIPQGEEYYKMLTERAKQLPPLSIDTTPRTFKKACKNVWQMCRDCSGVFGLLAFAAIIVLIIFLWRVYSRWFSTGRIIKFCEWASLWKPTIWTSFAVCPRCQLKTIDLCTSKVWEIHYIHYSERISNGRINK